MSRTDTSIEVNFNITERYIILLEISALVYVAM